MDYESQIMKAHVVAIQNDLHYSLFTIHYSRRPNLRAFTLAETLIYVALFSLITSFVLVVFYQIIAGNNQDRNRVEVDAEAHFMMQKMLWALTGAQTINQPAVGASSSTLSVTKYNYGQNPIVFDIGSRNLRITKGAGSAALLGSSRVFVNQLTFQHLAAVQNTPEAVKITLNVISSDITMRTASTTLENTIYLRK